MPSSNSASTNCSPQQITLVHGPGCPVCVTPLELIDKAIHIASRPGVTSAHSEICSEYLAATATCSAVKAAGGDVRIVYSPMDALKIARDNPAKKVVFFAVGFETTAPANAMSVFQAEREKLPNYSILVSHVLVPPAMEAILSSASNRVQGFLAAGHVCAVMGYTEYYPIVAKYHVPVVVTGFEPLDILQGVYLCVKQLEEDRAEVENQYTRVVRREGNAPALQIIREVFRVIPRKWRGIGEIPQSGFGLAPKYATFDAEPDLALPLTLPKSPGECISGEILQGVRNRSTARPSGRAAPPSTHSAPPWFPPKAPAPPTTATAAIDRRRWKLEPSKGKHG